MHQDTIRQQIRAKLKLLPPQQRLLFAEQMTKLAITKLRDTPGLDRANHIACYWPHKHEINTIALINHLLAQHKYCYLPVINNQKQLLNFIKYTAENKLTANQFGILEPEFNRANQIDPSRLDLIFMPLVAFDAAGHRIGSGAGLFDRSIKSASCPRIGLAYAAQQYPAITPNPWDIPMNYVITEQNFFTCQQPA